ncbi:MAG TPA: immunoglobulin domain-containing protein, partial [Candidatus Limnocylindrales bacterium]|nr:immunoglobulin domain-containing protein [Candidatus Limnocylindrales bacterium]
MNTFKRANIMALAAITGLFAVTNAFATTSSADSNITTVDTRLVGITSPPQSQLVQVGANVTFTVAVAGVPPFSYQWFKNGSAISGATNATLNIT